MICRKFGFQHGAGFYYDAPLFLHIPSYFLHTSSYFPHIPLYSYFPLIEEKIFFKAAHQHIGDYWENSSHQENKEADIVFYSLKDAAFLRFSSRSSTITLHRTVAFLGSQSYQLAQIFRRFRFETAFYIL